MSVYMMFKMCIRFALSIGNISKIIYIIVKFCKYRLLKNVKRKHVFNKKKKNNENFWSRSLIYHVQCTWTYDMTMHVFICSMQETTSKSWRRPCQTPWVTLECSWNMAARKYWSKNQHSVLQKYSNHLYLSCDWRILTLKLWDCLGLPEVHLVHVHMNLC